MSAVIGIDLGASKIAGALVLDAGETRHSKAVPTPARAGAGAVLDAIAALAAEISGHARADGLASPRALGVGAAGVIDAQGTVIRATDHIAGWAGTAISAGLHARTRLRVTTINDVHAHALGEARHGAGIGATVVLLAAVGSGIGSALVVDGVLQRGAHGGAGGLGHVACEAAAGLRCPCGRDGHLEAIASGPGLLAAYARRGGDAADLPVVCARARAGEPLAREVVDLGARALGRALAGAIALADPDVVIVTGGVARGAGVGWCEALRRSTADALAGAPCPIRPGRIGELSAVIGAAACVPEPART